MEVRFHGVGVDNLRLVMLALSVRADGMIRTWSIVFMAQARITSKGFILALSAYANFGRQKLIRIGLG